MIELPEVVTIAAQMQRELKGRKIAAANGGNSPHKWFFCKPGAGEIAEKLIGRRIERVEGVGAWIHTHLRPRGVLTIGALGGRILLHGDAGDLPKKHQVFVGFDDGRSLTVAVQGWGFARLGPKPQAACDEEANRGLPPNDARFTYDYFKQLVADALAAGKRLSVKQLLVSKPGLGGLGNGCLQDILFAARIHPKRQVAEISPREQQALFRAIRKTTAEMIRLGGRDEERDLYNHPGGYRPVMDKRTRGTPCPTCGTPIEKIAYLGGSCYLCPKCQT